MGTIYCATSLSDSVRAEMFDQCFLECAMSTLLSAGAVYSWGDGDYGKLGRGGSDGCKTPKVIEKLQGKEVTRVFCGSQFSLALTKTGALYTW